MKKIKRLLSLTAILLVLLTSLIGISLVLDLITTESAVDTATKLFQVFGIATVATALVIGILHVSKSE